MRARDVAEVGKRLLRRYESQDEKVLEAAIAKFPCRAFVSQALSLYAESGSFAMAEKRETELLLPHAKYLAAADIERLDEIIRKNEYDQILNAKETATILAQVLDQTRNLLPEAVPHWAAIADYIVRENAASNYAYPKFLTELKKAGIEVPEIPQPDE